MNRESTKENSDTWFSDRSVLTVITFVSVVLGLTIVFPYLEYILLGAIVTYVLLPIQRWLELHVGRTVAAVSIAVGVVLAIILPALLILAVALREAIAVATAFQRGVFQISEIEVWVADTLEIELSIGDIYGTYEDEIRATIESILRQAIQLAGELPSLLIGLTVTTFVLFALLRDREKLVAWLYQVLPVDDAVQRELFTKFDELMWASLVGNIAVAGIQAISLGVMLFILDVPAVVFFSVATFVLALLPLIGAFGVWMPVSLYLVIINRPIAAGILVVSGSIISLSDNYFRPAVIGRSTAFNPAIVVVGIFGGLVVFGAVGLFIGPVVLGGAKITVDVFAHERAAATSATIPERTLDDFSDTANEHSSSEAAEANCASEKQNERK